MGDSWLNRHSHAVFPAILILGALMLAGRMVFSDLRPVRAQTDLESAYLTQTRVAYMTQVAPTLTAEAANQGSGSGQAPTPQQPAAPAVTATNTATSTPTLITPGVASSATPTRTPAAGATPTHSPLPTATPTISGATQCQPGNPFTVAGSAPPRAPLLLYFNGRAVGGGSAGLTGQFALTLTVGRERPGVYPISVRLRGDGREVLRTVCEVTILPPRLTTPTPRGG